MRGPGSVPRCRISKAHEIGAVQNNIYRFIGCVLPIGLDNQNATVLGSLSARRRRRRRVPGASRPARSRDRLDTPPGPQARRRSRNRPRMASGRRPVPFEPRGLARHALARRLSEPQGRRILAGAVLLRPPASRSRGCGGRDLPALDRGVLPSSIGPHAARQAADVAPARPVAFHRGLPFPGIVPGVRAALRPLSLARQQRPRRFRRARFRRPRARLRGARSHHRGAEPVDRRRGPALGAIRAAAHRAYRQRDRPAALPSDGPRRGPPAARAARGRAAGPLVRRHVRDIQRAQGLRTPAEGAARVCPHRRRARGDGGGVRRRDP
jgi:hypothetical protein